jgi:phosphoribosyl 1,2-cyclic phosphodiesterase
VKIKLWGAGGSNPPPGPETMRYGGNTSCVQVFLSDGSELILDAGTGIRPLGLAYNSESPHLQILLTHLHMDHIQGLLFFAPSFLPETEMVIWGPAAPNTSLEDRIARYISAPHSPIEVRELPSHGVFRESPATEWQIGSARILAASVTHRGPTLGFRIVDGDCCLCYIPDHEPAMSGSVEELEPEWISGYDLAHGADLLIHDCQYLDREYPDHVGWGHSGVSDALSFAHRVEARRTLLTHHDPLHSDALLDDLFETAEEHWAELGGAPGTIELAVEGVERTVSGRGEPAPA